MTSIPHILLEHLQKLEPNSTFIFRSPVVSSSSGKKYYVKTGPASSHEQWTGEAESLRLINKASKGLCPTVLAQGADGDQAYFISEYCDTRSLTLVDGAELMRRLATELHMYKSTRGFGFDIPTYCGDTKLSNGWFESWSECYGSQLRDLSNQLRNRSSSYQNLSTDIDIVCDKVVPYLLGNIDVEPVLLHGDLWSGNVALNATTKSPLIYDPSSYFGHFEADLAIGRIFGGIPSFSSYWQHRQKTSPVEQFELRAELYELFHYLNHTLLFGGDGYQQSSQRIIQNLLAQCNGLSKY